MNCTMVIAQFCGSGYGKAKGCYTRNCFLVAQWLWKYSQYYLPLHKELLYGCFVPKAATQELLLCSFMPQYWYYMYWCACAMLHEEMTSSDIAGSSIHTGERGCLLIFSNFH